jgi:hypothetical protein
MDIDDPTIENVQVLLLLSNAFFQAGKGKKSYMLLSQYPFTPHSGLQVADHHQSKCYKYGIRA